MYYYQLLFLFYWRNQVFFLEVGKTGTHYIRKIIGKLAEEQKVSYLNVQLSKCFCLLL